MRKKADQFQTIRTEGAILPPDVLRRIAAQAVDGVRPKLSPAADDQAQ